MPDGLVTPDQYPDLESFTLRSARGERIGFVGRIIDADAGKACTMCDTEGTVSAYRGPQHGLAIDTSVEIEITWCSEHGLIRSRLLNQDGSEHSGP